MRKYFKNTNNLSKIFQEFFKSNASSGIILIICTAIALAFANSSLHNSYHDLWLTPIPLINNASLHFITNEILMSIFFFLVGLEIKRELITGELNSYKKAALPVIAATGGVILPAVIYLLFNYNTYSVKGWAVPIATDIAFTLGIISLLGARIPNSIKVFVSALAIADDLAAVIVIALFYTIGINYMALLYSGIIILLLVIANYLRINKSYVYILLGSILWYAMLKSGVHSTIAGVVTALLVPATAKDKNITPILYKLEHSLSGFVAYVVMPLFVLANAGVTLQGISYHTIFNNISIGILLGLFLGKPIGISLFVFLSEKLKITVLPEDTGFKEIFGVSILCGIGFTMSLFVSNLAFPANSVEETSSKAAILLASLFAGVFGFILLRFFIRKNHISD